MINDRWIIISCRVVTYFVTAEDEQFVLPWNTSSSDRCKVNKREASNYDDKGRNDNEALLAWSSEWRCSLNLETHGSPITLEMHYAPERSNRLIKTPIIRCLELISGYICKYSNDHFRARILFRLVKNLTNI